MGAVFDAYTEYYDLLYHDKDYASEASYVLDLIQRHGNGGRTLLEFGCGTGNHSRYFAESGYKVTGIDRSPGMIETARRKGVQHNLNFYEGDARTFRDGIHYDVVISLFHVASYQTSNEDICRFLETAAMHLKSGGVLIFDFWYAPAVLTQKPEVRVKRVENDRIRVVRIAEPELDVRRSIVTVNFEVLIQDRRSDRLSIVHERHEMRYFCDMELQHILENCGLKSLRSEEWRSGKPLSESTWSAVWVATKP